MKKYSKSRLTSIRRVVGRRAHSRIRGGMSKSRAWRNSWASVTGGSLKKRGGSSGLSYHRIDTAGAGPQWIVKKNGRRVSRHHNTRSGAVKEMKGSL